MDSTSIPRSSPNGSAGSIELPVEPVVVMEAKKWSPLDVGELWRHRELLFFMVWRDVKVRYKQTLLGAAWAIIQPFTTMIVFTIFFGKLAKVPSEGLPYPIFAYAGLLPWTFFAGSVTKGSSSLVSESRLISKVFFPRMILPASAVGAGLVDFAVALMIYFGLMVYYGVGITAKVFLLPFLLFLTAMLAFAMAMLLGTWNVQFRDIRQVIPFGIQIWLFASPVIYPTTLVPEGWRWVLLLNPMTGIIDGFRAVLFVDRPVNWGSIGISCIISLTVLVLATWVFRRFEKTFADII